MAALRILISLALVTLCRGQGTVSLVGGSSSTSATAVASSSATTVVSKTTVVLRRSKVHVSHSKAAVHVSHSKTKAAADVATGSKTKAAAVVVTADAVTTSVVSPQSNLASIISFMSVSSPNFAKVFEKTRAPTFLLANFEKHAYKYTLFYPTDAALARYKPQGACAKIPMSNILQQLMVPKMYTSADLVALKRGYTMRTMSAVYLRTLGKDKKGHVKIGIVNGYQKIVSWATIVKTDVVVNKRAFVMHQIDNIITNCDAVMPPQ